MIEKIVAQNPGLRLLRLITLLDTSSRRYDSAPRNDRSFFPLV